MEFIFQDGPGSFQQPQTNTSNLIDKGAFFDRFGPSKMAVLLSADPTIKAILADIANRNWITIDLPEVTAMVQHIASVVPEVTEEIQAIVLNPQVGPMENLALRKLFFS